MNPRTATLIAGLVVALVAGQSLGRFGGGVPSIVAPASMLLVYPVFMGLPVAIVIGAFVACFWLWRPSLFAGEPRVPNRTIVLLAVATGASAFMFIMGWDYARKYQDYGYALFCLVASALMLVGCVALVWKGRMHPSFRSSLVAHIAVFAWLASYAFPYMGETP